MDLKAMLIRSFTEFIITTLMIPAAVLVCIILQYIVAILKLMIALKQLQITKLLLTVCSFLRIGMKLGKISHHGESCSFKNS